MSNKYARESVSPILTAAPYVAVNWDDNSSGRAMVDTGADWSLISEESLTVRERLAVRPSGVRGCGVSNEHIPVLGEIWRTICVGDVVVPNQRFVVVRGLVVPAILGIDFWSRLVSMTLNLQTRRLLLEEQGVELQLFSAPRPASIEQRAELRVRRDVTVPPATEALVPAKRRQLKPGEEYLLEPVGGEDSPVSATACVICPSDDDTVWVKVANIGAGTDNLA